MTIILWVSAKSSFVALAACFLFFFASTQVFAQQSLSPSGSTTKKITSKKKLPIKKSNSRLKKNNAQQTEIDGGFTISSMKRVKPTSSDRDLRSLPQVGPTEAEKNQEQEEVEQELPFVKDKKPLPGVVEPTYIRPEQPLDVLSPNPIQSFDGLDYANWGVGHPPDTVGDVGPNHYIQAVNSSIGIYNKTGTRLAAFTFNNFWAGQGAGTACANTHKGDPTVVYDPQNNRWIVADFAFVSKSAPPYYECIAVSKTGDPVAGGWWYYAIRGDDAAHPWLPDYPKMGIWGDGLYMTANMFAGGSAFREARVYAFRLSDLINGTPVANVVIDTISDPNRPAALLPANYRGTLPPAGRDAFIIGEATLDFGFIVYKFRPDFAVPANSTFTGPTVVSQSAYGNFGFTVPSSGNGLDTVGDRLLMQAQYRNINGVESLWVQHNVGPPDQSGQPVGIQWAQINVTGGTIVANPVQQQIYNNLSGDGLHRWMGSLAVDRQGNMALGYSVTNTGVNPSIRYNGRLSTDPLNTLPQGEVVMQAGGGSQSGNCPNTTVTCTRWGDYSAMTVDPTDDCTFWYTNQYYSVSGLNWQTRIASFRFPGCVATKNLTVTRADDRNNPTCAIGDCSLREALNAAGSDGAPDIITFNIPANSAGCVGTNCTITLTTPLAPAADAGDQTLIDGGAASANTITLRGGGQNRILTVGASVNLNIDNLNFTGGNGFNGAAIGITGGTLRLSNSALYGNSSNNDGGALRCETGCVMDLRNVTISGNSSATTGGGIFNNGTVTATDCTITGNSGFTNGGIGNSGAFNIRNTIIAGNTTAVFANNADATGAFTSQGYNLVGKIDGSSGFTATGDQTGTVASPLNARLAPLGNYGGKTLTHALLDGGAIPSPAINAGTATGATSTDQRGAIRIGAVDIGAFEVNNTPNGGTFVALLPVGRRNDVYQTQIITASNGSFTYSIASGALPLGVTLTPNFAPTAVVALSGTPTESGIFDFAIRASSGANSNTSNYRLVVLAPTSANVSVAGRVMVGGRGLTSATVTLTDSNGNSRTAATSFGYYRFDEVEVGQTYIVSVRSKRYQFAPQIVNVIEDLSELNFFSRSRSLR